MALSCGIVGLPNVGKSTIFNAITAAGAAAANFPFTTIEPNTGVVKVPDDRLERIGALVEHKQMIPAAMTFVDIAGLVKGASKGEGLGNQFLAHIRETDAIAHVVRCFSDPNVIHVAGATDPLRDAGIVETELLLADLQAVEKGYATLEKTARSGVKEAAARFSAASKVRAVLEAGKPARAATLNEEEAEAIREYHLLTLKPVLYLANVDDSDAANPDANSHVAALKAHAAKEGAQVAAICGKLEAELGELGGVDHDSFLKELGMTEPGLNRVIRTGYALLGLITFFTTDSGILRAWPVRKGWKAPRAAGVIHTDFERGFIRAEVCHFDDLVRHKSEHAMREAGALRQEGKEYVVRDGDIIHFKFAV